MDKKGPGSLRDFGSFERLHPPFIDLTLMSRRGAVHCLHTYRWPRLEAGPRHQQNCTDCHKDNAGPVRSEPQESHAAPWRLQSVANRPGGIWATQRSPPNSSACHVQESAENEQRAKPDQEHSRLSIHRCRAQQNRDSSRRRPNRSGGWNHRRRRVLDRPARINLRAFPTKRTVSGSPPGPSAFIGD